MKTILLMSALLAATPANAGTLLEMGSDKPAHIALGAGTYLICRALDYSPGRCMGASLGVGLAVELVQARQKGHTSSFDDMTATLFGGATLFLFERRF